MAFFANQEKKWFQVSVQSFQVTFLKVSQYFAQLFWKQDEVIFVLLLRVVANEGTWWLMTCVW